jgi:hypothetical protein
VLKNLEAPETTKPEAGEPSSPFWIKKNVLTAATVFFSVRKDV